MNDATDNTTPGDAGPRGMDDARTMARFNAIENQVRRLHARNRVLGVGLLLALAAAAASWAAPGVMTLAANSSPDVVEAQRVVLRGADGAIRGEWGVDEEGNAAIRMLDRQGRERMVMSVRSAGDPGLSLINGAGERRVALGLLPDETTSLVFADGAGVPRAVLGLLRGDAANLLLADAGGVSRIGFGLDGEGVGSVILPDSSMGTAGPVSRDSTTRQ